MNLGLKKTNYQLFKNKYQYFQVSKIQPMQTKKTTYSSKINVPQGTVTHAYNPNYPGD